MARIAFLLEHEEGHLNPTFCLARRLEARGHDVAYLGLADGGNYVRSQGFEFHPILERLAPAGTLRTQREVAATGTGDGDRGAEMRVAQEEGPHSIYRRSWFEMVTGDESLDRAMRAIRPDLLLLTSFFAPHALVLRYRYGVPIVLLTPMLRTYGKSRHAELLGDILMDGGAAAQFIAMFEGDLWRRNATHANAMAARLAGAVRDVPGVEITQAVETNAVFARIPYAAIEPLQDRYPFGVWDERRDEVRWMCSWDTTEGDVDGLAAAIGEVLGAGETRVPASAAPDQ